MGLKPQPDGPSYAGLSHSLGEAVGAATVCWVCGWMSSVVMTRSSELGITISPADYESVTVSIAPHIIYLYQGRKEGQYALNRLVIQCDRRSIGGRIDYLLYLQKSDDRPKGLSDILAQVECLDWPKHEPYEARIRPPEIDFRLLRRWKECCNRSHRGRCDATYSKSTIWAIRLIDVVDKCIVQRSSDAKWLALSYCWGEHQDQTLRTDNLKSYQQRGSLTDGILPPSIRDAMTVTKSLGERYLWVDSMCIIQDDEKDKLTFLNIMGDIYAYALVTIINAASTAASTGLPGINESIRRRAQKPFQLNNVWLLEALDPSHGPYSGYLESTKWYTRGWTFQEGLLSPRCLIFTADQVYWQCRAATWCEDSFWEGPYSPALYRHFSGEKILSSLTDISTGKDWFNIYIAILREYLQRRFSSESDRLHALEGILEVLERATKDGYFWGMPRAHMEPALAWKTYSAPARRDCTCNLMQEGGKIVASKFPTWSWTGWQGNVDMGNIRPSALDGLLGLLFFHIENDNTPRPIGESDSAVTQNNGRLTQWMDKDEMLKYPRDAVHAWMDSSRKTILKSEIPSAILSQHVTPALLCFWTSTAILRMQQNGWNDYYNCPGILTGHADVNFYAAWERDRNLKLDQEYGKFIVIGAEKMRPSQGGRLALRLLYVDIDSYGISYRHKLVTSVLESDWNALENRKWEIVFLA